MAIIVVETIGSEAMQIVLRAGDLSVWAWHATRANQGWKHPRFLFTDAKFIITRVDKD